jgi:hypothetical protein
MKNSAGLASRLVRKIEHARVAFKSPSWLKDVIKPASERCNSTDNSIKYVTSGSMQSARHLRKIGLGYPKLSRGFHWLSRIRVGGFIRYKDAERCGFAPSLKMSGGGTATCPCCLSQNGTSDTLTHYLLHCRGPLIEVEGKSRRQLHFTHARGNLNLRQNIINILLVANQTVQSTKVKNPASTPIPNAINPTGTTSSDAASTSVGVDTPLPGNLNTTSVNMPSSDNHNPSIGVNMPSSVDHNPSINTTTPTPAAAPQNPSSPKNDGNNQIPPDSNWVTDTEVVQALLSGSEVPATGRTRFLQIMNLGLTRLSPELKSTHSH